ncbi:MAG TPA: thiamine phosphate synthase [Candidatus Acidoferrales bacterium]|nr:thiamine phosphate synthase [Candidatus Acidoferrales bacterium]
MQRLSGIYAILDGMLGSDLDALLASVLAAGVRLVQYREKRGIDRLQLARLHRATSAAGATLIVNDDLEAALLADGVHLGQEDLEGHDAGSLRARLGTRLLGISCSTVAEARAAAQLGADYLGVGPYNATATKGDAGPAIGAAGIARIAQATVLPVAAIGGIGLADLAPVYAAGAKMAAIASAIARAPEPQKTAGDLVRCWQRLMA